MHSKVYWITYTPEKRDAMLAQYDELIVPAINNSDAHVGHHMVEVEAGRLLLVSNYTDKAAMEASAPMVQELIKPMVEENGMALEVITDGEVIRTI